MSDLGLLKNEGVLALNPPKASQLEKTVVVLGGARGGTTMVASVLQALGVSMGENLGPVLEDVALSEVVESRDRKRFQALVARRNREHPVWGWKRPAALEFTDVWEKGFRNPYIIAVFRDPFAIANRNRISMLSDVFPNMERSIQHLDRLVQFLRRQDAPILLCSYEKVLANPGAFVRAVDDFLDLNAGALREAAEREINPASQAYLETSRITQSSGHLDVVNTEVCAGWAFYPKLPKHSATVQIMVNDRLVHTVIAGEMRADLKEKGIHPTGKCGFKFRWPKGISLDEGDQVMARVEGDIKPLGGSPKALGARVAKAVGRQRRKEAQPGALPDFYCIGAQKAGTTWLHEMLKAHPLIHLPESKEVHYWDVHHARPLSWYRQNFVPGRVNGDITPAYAILPEEKIRKVHGLTPNARVLFSMRNPVDRAWSFVQMEIERKYKECPPDLMAGEPEGEVLAYLRERLFHPGCLARSNYAMTLRRWRRIFGESAVMPFRYDRIVNDPQGLLGDICRHLGVDEAWVNGLPDEVSSQRVFPSKKVPFPALLREEFIERTAHAMDDLEKEFGERFDEWRK